MITDIWRVVKTLVTFADDLQKYHSEIKEIRQELRNITIIVHGLAQQVKHSKELNEASQKRLLLEVENRLQALERQLPSIAPKKPRKKKS